MEQGAKTVLCLILIWVFFCMRVVFSDSFFMTPSTVSPYQSGMFSKYEYTRYQEVRQQCHSIISSASELELDRFKIQSLKDELSFYNGDWGQYTSSNKALVPIPFHKSSENLFHLASFTVFDAEEDRQSASFVKIIGSMDLLITNGKYHGWGGNDSTMEQFPRDNSFEFMPGFSQVKIMFEGIYSEPETFKGERVLCLLGKTSTPIPIPDSSHSQELGSSSWRTRRNQFILLQDAGIRMVLHYPKSFSLTSRVIHGDITSLRNQEDRQYFGTIKLASQLGSYSSYQFKSGDIVSEACTSYPYHENVKKPSDQVDDPSQVCELLNIFASGTYLVFPNMHCNTSLHKCNELGPFKSLQTGVFGRRVNLQIEGVRCEVQPPERNTTSAKVSATVRAVTEHSEVRRSSIDETTLAAEGTWSSEGGQLCMVGCLGPFLRNCDTRILMYFPTSFSITQRYAIVGRISNAKSNGVDPDYSLSFGGRVHTGESLYTPYTNISYKYTKFEDAIIFLEKNEPFDFKAVVKKTLLRYPNLDGSSFEAFRLLAEDLSFKTRSFLNSSSYANIGIDIFTIGSFFHYHWVAEPARMGREKGMPEYPKTQGSLLLNVSATLVISDFNEERLSNISELLLEGVYNLADGRMYMIACRDARPWWNLSDIFGLKDGMDCSIHVEIEYPPVTARWLMSEQVKITISSQRTDGDPILFDQVVLSTLPITYRSQREDVLSRENIEGVLQILTLSITIACIFSQLLSIRKDISSVPYISIVKLGVLALGYGIPLIGGAGSLIFGRKSKSQQVNVVDFQSYQSSHIFDYFVKILFLVAFLLTLRLVQKVWKSRTRLLSNTPPESKQVPTEKLVLFACVLIHMVGFLVVVIVNGVTHSHSTAGFSSGIVGYSNSTVIYKDMVVHTERSRTWSVELEEYVGMVQDFFLLPQVIGNMLWQPDGKPLRKMYYIGITILRILPHIYDYMRTPVSYPYEQDMPEMVEFVNPDLDFYSKFGDIAIPIVASLLAIIVFCQQQWKCQKLYQLLGLERLRAPFFKPRAYERIPSVMREAELVGINENAGQRHL